MCDFGEDWLQITNHYVPGPQRSLATSKGSFSSIDWAWAIGNWGCGTVGKWGPLGGTAGKRACPVGCGTRGSCGTVVANFCKPEVDGCGLTRFDLGIPINILFKRIFYILRGCH